MNSNKTFNVFLNFLVPAGQNRLLQLLILIFSTYSVSGQISRIQVINNAEGYVHHTWTADSANIWQNVSCSPVGNIRTPAWVRVDTINTGVPYCWGGWSSVSSFDTGISNGKSAGDIDCTTSGDLTEKCAVGVDCSGLVTNAWGISSHKYSTSTLMNITTGIALSASRAGDILNWPYHHTRIVVGNNITTTGFIDVIESSAADWKVAKHSYKPSALSSYEPRSPNSTIVFDSGTSIPSNAGKCTDFILYPNPTSNMLTVKSGMVVNDRYKLTLLNTSGQILFTQDFTASDKLLETQLDMSELSGGIYFLSIKSNKINQVYRVLKH